MRELRRASTPLNRQIERFHQRLGQLARFLLETTPQRVEVAGNDGEKIIEVMGNAAGEVADRFEFLRLSECVFGVAPELRLGFQTFDVVQDARLADRVGLRDDRPGSHGE